MSKSLTSLSADELKQFMKENLPDGFSAEPQPQAAESKRICVGILSYDGNICARTGMSLLAAAMQCAAKGWGLTYILREGDSMVARGRSFIASQFLENPESKNCTDLVFVDTDLVWDNDEFIRLCSYPVDIVAGSYPFKGDDESYPLRWSPDGLYEQNGLWCMQAVTPGFLRITRKALERIVVEVGNRIEFKDHGAGGLRTWMFFDNLQRPNGVFDEGFVFCEHARLAGFTIHLDPDMEFGHIGRKLFRHTGPRKWLEKKAETTTKLMHEHPGVAPLNLAGLVMTRHHEPTPEEVAKANETNDQHSDARTAGTPAEDAGTHASERQPERHKGNGVSRRRRSRNAGQLEVIAGGQSAPDLSETKGR